MIESIEEEKCIFEQGPIRPPSEADSLLIRITRNCPWNKCTFCTVYKEKKFSIRNFEEIKRDIDLIFFHFNQIDRIINKTKNTNIKTNLNLEDIQKQIKIKDKYSYSIALNWYIKGAQSIFLQDANSLITKPEILIRVLKYIKNRFNWLSRITSYARSHTLIRIKEKDLKEICINGLSRIHVGMESGSNNVLEMVKKGCSKLVHIKAGQRSKKAGMELSEYVMPGLGGKKFSKEHALETADALNQINPDFIRLRTLVVPKNSKLYKMSKDINFEQCSGVEIAKEIKLFLENLKNINSTILSDHMYNLFGEVNGKFPQDKKKMISILNHFLKLSPHEQCLFQVGKRIGFIFSLAEMKNKILITQIAEFCKQNNINENNIDQALNNKIGKFI